MLYLLMRHATSTALVGTGVETAAGSRKCPQSYHPLTRLAHLKKRGKRMYFMTIMVGFTQPQKNVGLPTWQFHALFYWRSDLIINTLLIMKSYLISPFV